MTDVERQAWINMGKVAIIIPVVLVAIWGWYEFWVLMATHVLKTPLPRFDAIWFSALSPVVPLLLWKGLVEWHKFEVDRITDDLNQKFDDL